METLLTRGTLSFFFFFFLTFYSSNLPNNSRSFVKGKEADVTRGGRGEGGEGRKRTKKGCSEKGRKGLQFHNCDAFVSETRIKQHPWNNVTHHRERRVSLPREKILPFVTMLHRVLSKVHPSPLLPLAHLLRPTR